MKEQRYDAERGGRFPKFIIAISETEVVQWKSRQTHQQ